MKIGVFGDVHGNWFAFERIFHALHKERCDRLFFLGDICGYYYRQNDILDILRNTPNLEGVRGNHDDAFLQTLSPGRTNRADGIGKSFVRLRESITPENREYLESLPASLIMDEYGTAFFHGSPWSPLTEYIYPDSGLERFNELPYRLVFLGHTHYPMDIRIGDCRVVNPGSAGQPRNGGWPSYAVYDYETGVSAIRQVPYDVSAMTAEVRDMKEEDPYLLDVLERVEQ